MGPCHHPTMCNISSEDACEETRLHSIIFISVTAVMVILITSSFFLNILTIVSVHKFKRLQIPANYILVNLSICDCSAAVAAALYVTSELIDGGEVACVTSLALVFVTFSASLLGLALVGYDRFSALVKPLTYSSRLTYQRIALYMACIWTYSSVVTVISLCIILFGHDSLDSLIGSDQVFSSLDAIISSTVPVTTPSPNGSVMLTIHSDLLCISGIQVNAGLICQTLLIFTPGAVVMFYCYGRVMVVARHHSRAISAVQGNLNHSKFNKTYGMFKGKKYFVTLTSILGEFVLTWAAFATLTILDIFCPDCLSDNVVPHRYVCTLALVTIGVNPWIYACRSHDFKKAYRRLYRKARQFCKLEPPPANRGRRDSRFSDNLSRTNSLVGNMQHLQALYNETYYKQKALNNNGTRSASPGIELPSLSHQVVETVQTKTETNQTLMPD